MMLSVYKVAGGRYEEESGEIWTLVTLRRLPLVTTRPQHQGGGGRFAQGRSTVREILSEEDASSWMHIPPPRGHVILVAFRV